MFRKTLIIMLAAEAISLLSFGFNFLSLPLLILVFAAALVISLKRLEWGVYILFGELFFGSRGHLLEYGFLSLRLVIFAAVFLAWVIKEIEKSKIKNQNDNSKFKILGQLSWSYWALLLIIILNVLQGYLKKNGLSNVFFDANGYLYLAVLPAVLAGIKTRGQVSNLFQILGAAIIVIALKTLTLFIWFTYGITGVATLYHWVIRQDIGEITGNVGSASRIFMQSQFWALVGFFIFLFSHSPLSSPVKEEEIKKELPLPSWERVGARGWFAVASAIFSVIMSLSRSFWLGGVAGAIFFAGIWLFHVKGRLGRLGKLGGVILLIAAVEIGGIYLLSFGSRGISESVSSRGINPASEAAGGARLLLLPILLDRIIEAPAVGYGFGKTVSYDSFLPDRVKPENPAGTITSYAFEWGYLDTALKVGFLGLLVYLIFIARIFRIGIQNVKFKMQNLGILSGLVALTVLNVTTPYLNHPLGIGYLILALASFEVFNSESL